MFLKKIMTLSFVFLYILPALGGETGKIAGKIIDALTNEPLVGANIIISGKWVNGEEHEFESLFGASSDFEGDYFILSVPPGSYSVKVSYIGYGTQILTEIQVDIDKTTQVDFSLQPESYQTEEVLVTAYKPQTVEKDLTATKQVYNIGDIQNLGGVSDIADILELQADVIDNHFRGGREGESLYLIGGGSIINPLDNSRAFTPIVSGLQQVEVYTSGFSAEYGNAQSGIINMVAKEGGEVWETRFELSSAAPYYKTWGGSPYSQENMEFYNTLITLESWQADNPTQPGRSLWDAGYGFGSTYLPPRVEWPPNPLTLQDSLHIARLGQVAWMQSVRDIGLEYNNTLDYRFDFNTGGPIYDNLKAFVATRQQVEHATVPTANPDMERQVLGNFTFEPNNKDKFKLKFIYDYQFQNVLNSNFLRWLYDRTLSVSKNIQSTMNLGLDWQRIFNESTVLEIKANFLDVSNSERIELLNDDQFIEFYNNQTNWVDYTGPSGHRVGRANDDRINQNTYTYDLHTNLTYQFNKNNLLKSGLMFSYYHLEVAQDMNVSDPGAFRKVEFDAYPYEGALYIQDKLEYEGFIANIGLRFDFYNFNTNYFSDIYSPLRNPFYDGTKPYLERGQYYDKNLALKEGTKFYTRLQPRLGLSFPISEFSVIHLNYGTFTQRPPFSYIFFSQVTSFNEIEILGNPRLRPENTKAYDVGLVIALPLGVKLDISAYYKDVTDLIETAYYYDESQSVYRTYINRDYADIKGFHISAEVNEGALRGFVRYNYESATGKSSNALSAPVTFAEDTEFLESLPRPDPQDIYLDYDRTHKAVINLRYTTNKELGSILGDITLSSTLKLYTGRPYTWDETGEGLKYNQRTPVERDLRLRLEKKIPFGKQSLTFYGEGFNLLNHSVYHYSRTFNDGRNTVRWEKDRENILTHDEFPPYYSDQSVYLFNNEPIHFRFGLIYKF